MSRFISVLVVALAVIFIAYSIYAFNASSNTEGNSTDSDVTSSPANSPVDFPEQPIINPNTSQVTEDGSQLGADSMPSSPSGTKVPDHLRTGTPSKEPNGNASPSPDNESATTPVPSPTNAPPDTESPTKSPTKKATKSPVTDKPTQKPTHNAALDVKTVSAPGKETYTNDEKTVTIDASNTSDGYVAVKYSGTNPKIKVIITKGNDKYTYDICAGDFVYFPLQMGNGTYNISVYENISGSEYMPVIQQDISVNVENEDDIFLYPNQLVWFDKDSTTVKKSVDICSGCDSDFEKVSTIFDFVSSNIKYDYDKAATVSSGYIPDIDSILSSKKGICFDYASVFASMCRAHGIPTKLAIGYVNQNSSMVYHAWNYVYTEETGWITVSFYLDKKGYNLVDATFYSTISDKSTAADFINENSNYQVYHIY